MQSDPESSLLLNLAFQKSLRAESTMHLFALQLT